MQDFPPFHGSIFSGGGGGGGGGLLGYPALASPHNQPPPPPPVKCPRCDSTNTKFCYYNNYNLSQPRHFCKACRRYWTMGGVLRDVPVGGGCRKSKRSSKATSPAASADKNASRRWHPPSTARSSIYDSTGTASSIAVASTSAPFSDSPLLASQLCVPSPTLRLGQLPDSDPPIPEATIMETPSVDVLATIPSALLGFIFPDTSPAREKAEAEPIGPGFADQTSPVDRRPPGAGGGLLSPNWAGPVEPTLYDLTGIVDPSSYWNQSHWSDSDTPFLPRLGD
ncbi:dof zinc finger protein DOF5.4-like [Zingiber officinale]|uniref:Dof zinc finger protein n=1 Tax=Zingiber officinale TaxID=94328 RepID=A0A8J5HRN1_ZINOF|nr:dof zinc finger protein DOF5.4-like [Zingiber officinale]KAG6534097.1 hypothetical protein ZIOFF_007981 [Zingiber officinale]